MEKKSFKLLSMTFSILVSPTIIIIIILENLINDGDFVFIFINFDSMVFSLNNLFSTKN